MQPQKPTLIIIPGLGDRVQWYARLVPLWNKLGFTARVFSFNWEDQSKSFTQSFDQLLHEIDTTGTPVHLIGASAGGSVAVNALHSRPDTVKRIVTVAGVFTYLPHLNSSKLRDSIDHLNNRSNPPPASHTLSLYGLYDQKVPTNSTRQLKAQSHRVLMIGHGAIIVTALTLYARSIRRFLQN